MNRIQLFEFEDFPWLPNAVRDSMTRMLTLLHGAVSNARTYTLTDLDELLLDVPTDGYQWTKGLRSAGPMKQLYLIGTPVDAQRSLEKGRETISHAS